MNPVAIIIPTLDEATGNVTGQKALLTAHCDARLIVVGGPKRGFTKTVNEGLAQLKPNEDACILNDDVSGFQLGWLNILQRALYSKKDYGIVGPSGKSAAISRIGRFGETGLKAVEQLSFWCVLIKSTVIDQIGILDKRFIHYASDNEYCIRARKHGFKIVWVKDVYLEHVGHGSGLIQKWKVHDHRELNRMLHGGN